MPGAPKAFTNTPFPLENLPVEVFEQVLTYLSYPYHELAKLRRVDRKFNSSIMRLLNQGFRAAERLHAKYLEVTLKLISLNIYFDPKTVQEVKEKLPRLKSERQNHQLYPHYGILMAMGFEISRLSFIFLNWEYNEYNLSCVPGKVIDEIISLLRTIQEEENPPATNVILRDLRDISTMAVKYFVEGIVPNLKIQLSQLKLEEKEKRKMEEIKKKEERKMEGIKKTKNTKIQKMRKERKRKQAEDRKSFELEMKKKKILEAAARAERVAARVSREESCQKESRGEGERDLAGSK